MHPPPHSLTRAHSPRPTRGPSPPGMAALPFAFAFLEVPDLRRCACVSKLWNDSTYAPLLAGMWAVVDAAPLLRDPCLDGGPTTAWAVAACARAGPQLSSFSVCDCKRVGDDAVDALLSSPRPVLTSIDVSACPALSVPALLRLITAVPLLPALTCASPRCVCSSSVCVLVCNVDSGHCLCAPLVCFWSALTPRTSSPPFPQACASPVPP